MAAGALHVIMACQVPDAPQGAVTSSSGGGLRLKSQRVGAEECTLCQELLVRALLGHHPRPR